MKLNSGGIDRIIRIVAGLALLAWAGIFKALYGLL